MTVEKKGDNLDWYEAEESKHEARGNCAFEYAWKVVKEHEDYVKKPNTTTGTLYLNHGGLARYIDVQLSGYCIVLKDDGTYSIYCTMGG